MSEWWRWPEDRRTGRVAWFVVLWRLLWWPLGVAGAVLWVLHALLVYGPREARRAFNELC